ncbi:MAG: hypothetical protein IKC11_05710 [Clostridia bacterium]|nr:hypothetical protein [Clostridia bacterium]
MKNIQQTINDFTSKALFYKFQGEADFFLKAKPVVDMIEKIKKEIEHKKTKDFELITKDARCTFKTRAEAEKIAQILEKSGISTIILPSNNAPERYILKKLLYDEESKLEVIFEFLESLGDDIERLEKKVFDNGEN